MKTPELLITVKGLPFMRCDVKNCHNEIWEYKEGEGWWIAKGKVYCKRHSFYAKRGRIK